MMRSQRLRSVVATLAVVVLMTMTTAAVAASSDKAHLVARGWAPLMVLSGAPPAAQAFRLMQRSMRINRAVLNNLQLTPELEAVYADVMDSLNDFDLEQLYERLPEEHNGWRSLALAGQYADGAYHVRRIPVAQLGSGLTALGQMQALLSLYPMPDPRGTLYRFIMRFRANVGPVGWGDALRAAKMGLVNLTRTVPYEPPRQAVAGVRDMKGQLSSTERRILAQIWTAFPATFGWYAQFGTLTNFFVESDSSKRAKHFRVTFKLKRDALEAHYPAVASYLEELGDFLTAEAVIKGRDGRWLKATLDTASLRTTLEFWLADGELVPTQNGRPLFNKIDQGIPETSQWRTIVSVDIRALGVQVHISNLVTQWRYDRIANGAHLSGLTSTMPDVRVEGRLLGILPTSWVQGLSPVTVKGTVKDFMEVLIDSNGGAGARLIANYHGNGRQGSTIMLAAKWDALNNFFVRFGMGMVSDRVIPSPEQAEGLRRIFTDALTMFGRDLQRWMTILANSPALTTR